MPKCDFNKVACNFIEIGLRHSCSSENLLNIFRKSFSKTLLEGAPFGFWLYITYTFLFMRNVLVLHCLLRLLQN